MDWSMGRKKSRHRGCLVLFPAWVAFDPVVVAGSGSMVHRQGRFFLYTVHDHQCFSQIGLRVNCSSAGSMIRHV